jgi:DHA2 family multidrug resistance protein-like MFS transporter
MNESQPSTFRPAAPAPDGLPVPQRYWSSFAIWCGIAIAVLETAMSNVALPAVTADMHVPPSTATWMVGAFQVAVTMILLPLASLGEIVGYRRVFLGGLVLFIGAALLAAVAPNFPALIVARFVQGAGAAAVMAVNGALIRFTWPHAMLGRGIGFNALVVAVASAVGPSIASALLEVASWRSLFVVNIVLGLVALAAGARFLPRIEGGGHAFDIRSALLNAVAFGAGFLLLSDGAHGHLSALTMIWAVLALGAGTALVLRCRSQHKPMVPLDLLRIPLLRLSYATSAAAFAGMMLVQIAMPFQLIDRFGLSHLEVGLFMTPWPIGTAVAATLAGRLVERYPAGPLGAIGMLMLAAGMLVLLFAPVAHAAPVLVAGMALCGFGFGLFQTPNNRLMLGVAPRDRAGAAAGMMATARTIGQTVGALLVGLLFRLLGPESVALLAIAALFAMAAAAFSLRRPQSPLE